MSSVVRFSNAPDVFAEADALFLEVEAQLRSAIPYAEIHHVGSTAIPGSFTKGDLDVLVRVPRSLFSAAEATLAEIFERNLCLGSDFNRTRPTSFCVSAHEHESAGSIGSFGKGKCRFSVISASFFLAAFAQPCHFGNCTALP